MTFESFEKFGLTREDFEANTYHIAEPTGSLTRDVRTLYGVSVKIKPLQIGVSSHERSEVLNLHKCFMMLYAIAENVIFNT